MPEIHAAEALEQKQQQLFQLLAGYQHCVVAFSGGVDSAVVAKAAHLVLQSQALAVTGQSNSLAAGELEQATELAQLIGIEHRVVQTQEFAQAAYLQNNSDRCYHCKTELYSQLLPIAADWNKAVIVNGANVDDLGDYRPGMIAAGENQVKAPLAECGINKQEVRMLAQQWGLPVWDKPATPCLSSRVAYGESVTPERLQMIDQAEIYLRSLGLGILRVRYHRNDLARIEIPLDQLSRLADLNLRQNLVAKFKELGFRYVTLDLEGFRSGSQNQILPVQILEIARP